MTPRAQLEADWLDLTRRILPALVVDRHWPVRADHCFQRIFLDAACGGVWYDHISARPAYAHASDAVLRAAERLARGAADGTVDLPALNDRSLAGRRAARAVSDQVGSPARR